MHRITPRIKPNVHPHMTYDGTSEADDGPHVGEHVAHGDGAEMHYVGHRQAGGVTELEHPQRQHNDRA